MQNSDMSKYTIITLDEVHSTNSYALENISFLEDSCVIYTSNQTLGRGRFNRKWISDDSDNIYMSVVLKPNNITNYPFANLTQYLSVVICKFLEKEFSIKPSIKWPNDILVDGAKLSGILAETYSEKNQISAIVLGLGLNVNMSVESLDKIDQKASSIYLLTGKNYNSEKLLRKLMDAFFENYNKFIEKGFEFIKEDYIKRCDFLGKNIMVSENGQKSEYFAQTIDDDGLLVVVDKFSNECKIITGDVLC